MAVNIEIGADFRKFFEKLDDAAQKVGDVGFEMQKAGLALSLSVSAPILALAREAVNASTQLEGVAKEITDLRTKAIQGLGDEIVQAFNLKENVKAFADWIKGLIDRFRELSPELKKLIITLAAVVAAIGPLSSYIGLLLSLLPVLTGALVFLATPMGAIVGLLGLIAAGFLALNVAAAAYNEVSEDTKLLVDGLKGSYQNLGTQLEKIQTLKDNAKNASTEQIQALKNETRQIILQTENLIKQAIARRELLKTRLSEQLQATLQSTRGVGQQGEFIGAEMATVNKLTKEINQLSAEIEASNLQIFRMYEQMHALDYEMNKVAKTTANVTQPIKQLKATGKKAEEIAQVVEDEFKPLISDLGETGKIAGEMFASNLANSTIKGLQSITENAIRFSEDLYTLIRNTLVDLAVTVGESLGNLVNGGTMKDFGKSILITVADFIGKLGKLLIVYGIGMLKFNEAMISLNAPLAIAAGIAMVAAGAAIKGALSKGLEGGGSSGGGGYTSGGGYGGASYNPQPLVLETRIEGNDIILVQKRTQSFTR